MLRALDLQYFVDGGSFVLGRLRLACQVQALTQFKRWLDQIWASTSELLFMCGRSVGLVPRFCACVQALLHGMVHPTCFEQFGANTDTKGQFDIIRVWVASAEVIVR